MASMSMSPIMSTYTENFEKQKQFRLKQLYTFDPKAAKEHTESKYNDSQNNIKEQRRRNDVNNRKLSSTLSSPSKKNSRAIVKMSDFLFVNEDEKKRKVSSGGAVIITPDKISLVEKCISVIDAVPDRFRTIQTLYLSNNSITSLRGIEQFQELRTLSLANNCIQDLSEIDPLSALTQLQVLSLEFNDVSYLPYYRYHIIKRAPSLRLLDNREITSKERSNVEMILKKEAVNMNLLFQNECTIAKLSHAIDKIAHFNCSADDNPIEFMQRLREYKRQLSRSAALDLNALFSAWDINIDPVQEADRDTVYTLMRRELCKIYNIRMSCMSGVDRKFNDSFIVAGKKHDLRGNDLWEICFSEILLLQQSTISNLLFELEQINDKAIKSISSYDPTNALNQLRELRSGIHSIHNDSRTEVKTLANEFKQSVFDMIEEFKGEYIGLTGSPVTSSFNSPSRNNEPLKREMLDTPVSAPSKAHQSQNKKHSQTPAQGYHHSSIPVPIGKYDSATSMTHNLPSQQQEPIDRDLAVSDSPATMPVSNPELEELKKEMKRLRIENRRITKQQQKQQEVVQELHVKSESLQKRNVEIVKQSERRQAVLRNEIRSLKQKRNIVPKEERDTEKSHESSKQMKNHQQEAQRQRESKIANNKLSEQFETMVKMKPNIGDSGEQVVIDEEVSGDIVQLLALSDGVDSVAVLKFIRRRERKERRLMMSLCFGAWSKYWYICNMGHAVAYGHMLRMMRRYFEMWVSKTATVRDLKNIGNFATDFFNNRLVQRSFDAWRNLVVEEKERETNLKLRAIDVEKFLAKRKAFDAWCRYLENTVYANRRKAMQFQELSERRLQSQYFHAWIQKLSSQHDMHDQMQRAEESDDRRIARHALTHLRRHVLDRQKRNIQMQQANELHEHLLIVRSFRALAQFVKQRNNKRLVNMLAMEHCMTKTKQMAFIRWKRHIHIVKYKRQMLMQRKRRITKRILRRWRRWTEKRIILKRLYTDLIGARRKRLLQNSFNMWNRSYSSKMASSFEKADRSLQEYRHHCSEQERQIADLQRENLNLVHKVHDLTASFSQLTIQSEDYEEQFKEQQNTISELMIVERSLSEENAALRIQQSDNENEIRRLKQHILELEDTRTENASHLISEVQGLHEKVEHLTNEVQQREYKLQESMKNEENMQRLATAAQEKLTRTLEIMSELRRTLDDKDKQYGLARIREQQLLEDLRHKTMEIDSKTQQLTGMLRLLEQRDEQITKMRYEMDILRADELHVLERNYTGGTTMTESLLPSEQHYFSPQWHHESSFSSMGDKDTQVQGGEVDIEGHEEQIRQVAQHGIEFQRQERSIQQRDDQFENLKRNISSPSTPLRPSSATTQIGPLEVRDGNLRKSVERYLEL